MNVSFPKGFRWGTATAALQIEGAVSTDGRGPSMWETFCRLHPERIYGQAGPEFACDHYHRWREDIHRIRDLGHNAYRFSISWPRIIPDGKGEVNQRGLAFYQGLIDELLRCGIEPCVTLYHWDLPQPLADIGGWESTRTSEAFRRYAEICFQAFGDRVPWWASFNEPAWMIVNGYLTGLHPPCRKDLTSALQVSLNVLGAHVEVWKQYHRMKYPGNLGIVLNVSPVYPAADNPGDRQAARLADAFLNRFYSEPLLQGTFPADLLTHLSGRGLLSHDQVPPELTSGKPRTDFLGVNYYFPHHASAHAPDTEFHINNSGRKQEPGRFALKDWFSFVPNPRGTFTDWGWEIYPEGLYDMLLQCHSLNPEMPVFVTENGIGLPDRLIDGRVDDPLRIDFIRSHLIQIHRAIQAGSRVRGYYHWSLMDNFSWINGYKKRYGLLYVDHRTFERVPKRSAAWFREIISNNGF